MNDNIAEKIDEMKNQAYDALFAEKLELQRKKNFWKGLCITALCILGAVTIGFVVYSALKKKFNNRVMANLKAHFSREVDDLDFIDLTTDDVTVDMVD